MVAKKNCEPSLRETLQLLSIKIFYQIAVFHFVLCLIILPTDAVIHVKDKVILFCARIV